MSLPTNAQARKIVPIASGFLDYFPDAVAAVAHLSWVGNNQHNPGSPLFWDRSKSQDEADALMRHFLERGTTDTDGIRHSAKVAWRALALLQKEIEAERAQPRLTDEAVDAGVPSVLAASPAFVASVNKDVLARFQARYPYPVRSRDPEVVEAYIRYLNTPTAELPKRDASEDLEAYLLRCFVRDEE